MKNKIEIRTGSTPDFGAGCTLEKPAQRGGRRCKTGGKAVESLRQKDRAFVLRTQWSVAACGRRIRARRKRTFVQAEPLTVLPAFLFFDTH